MAQQTAVEWLIKQLDEFNGIGNPWVDIPMDFFEQAKQMEKEQIIVAHNDGKNVLPQNETGDQYYKEKYGNKEML